MLLYLPFGLFQVFLEGNILQSSVLLSHKPLDKSRNGNSYKKRNYKESGGC